MPLADYTSEVQELIKRTQNRLKDYPDLYRVSEQVRKWDDDSIYLYLCDVRDDINVQPPQTEMSLEEMHSSSWGNTLVTGAMCFGLFGQATMETANQMQYSDNGLSLTLNYGPQYLNIATQLMQMYLNEKEILKKNVRPKGRGLLSSRTQMPTRINRILRHNSQFGGRY